MDAAASSSNILRMSSGLRSVTQVEVVVGWMGGGCAFLAAAAAGAAAAALRPWRLRVVRRVASAAGSAVAWLLPEEGELGAGEVAGEALACGYSTRVRVVAIGGNKRGPGNVANRRAAARYSAGVHHAGRGAGLLSVSKGDAPDKVTAL